MLSSAPTPAALTRVVDAFWRFEGHGAHRVLPDGCIDFVFDLVSGDARVVGPMQRAALLELPSGTRLFGVRFLPGAASSFIGVEASALVDLDPPLSELTCAACASLGERVAAATDDEARVALLARYLTASGARRRAVDARIGRAVTSLSRGAKVSQVAALLGLGERQLERLFLERVGVGPKRFARIARLQRTLSLSGSLSQADLAAHAGYADEPHLLREFRELAGVTPSALRAERAPLLGPMSDSSKPDSASGTRRTS
ncbi:MAG: helix-turn-helix transcriptional regulator [Polyangiaceae bacterium]